jgi:tRNA pseudouridine13 synthase
VKIPKIEKQLGMETFATDAKGIGGLIRQIPDDFVVEEVLVDGSKAKVKPESPFPEPSGEGRYLVCLLVKRDWDTLLVVRKIARQLGISEHRVQIAGIKDKKAVTAQHISIENIAPERLKRICIKDIHVYPLRYSYNMVFPHMSFGNAFCLTIRGISIVDTLIRSRTSNTREQLRLLGGIPNFFGHQRFGTLRPITHLVGKAFAQDDVEKAAMIFLGAPGQHEHPESRGVRERLQKTQDFNDALQRFPRRLLYERLMLSRLITRPKDYAGAFKRLPGRLCRLFLQAYQSYLFNRSLSQRLVRGIPLNDPQIGDYAVKTDIHGLPTNSHVRVDSSNLAALREAARRKKMYVAIPLIGYKQPPSEGVQGEIEQSLLEQEKIAPDDFRVRSMPQLSAKGGLRAALTPIMDLEIATPAQDEANPRKKKLQVTFTLHRGCYATVVLREFLKPRNVIAAGF